MCHLDANDSERPCSSVASEGLLKHLQTNALKDSSESHSVELIDNIESKAPNENISQSQEKEAERAPSPSSELSHDSTHSAEKGESNNCKNLTIIIVRTRIPYVKNVKTEPKSHSK